MQCTSRVWGDRGPRELVERDQRKRRLRRERRSCVRLQALVTTQWTSKVAFPPNLVVNVTKFVPHKALQLIT
jgi:hypothetical protein